MTILLTKNQLHFIKHPKGHILRHSTYGPNTEIILLICKPLPNTNVS